MKKPLPPAREAAEMLAVQALTFIAEDQERMSGFLAATGLEPGQIRAAAQQEGFFAGVLEHMLARRESPRCVCRQRRDRSGRDRARPRRARREMGARPAVSAFCRDCLADAFAQATRCGACGSPRIVRHDELARLSIAHIDCDAFYATIEKRDDPTLAAEPVIVGGGRRGVVAAACYVARTYGVRSAMPMFEALRLCPHARVVRPNMEKYARVGREVRQMMLALTPVVEPFSIDEAFLDLSGTERLHDLSPAKVLARFAIEVEKKLSITVSIGLSCNKFLAKIASDLDKPRGFAVLSATRSAGLPCCQTGELHFRRRQGERGAACARRLSRASPTCKKSAKSR